MSLAKRDHATDAYFAEVDHRFRGCGSRIPTKWNALSVPSCNFRIRAMIAAGMRVRFLTYPSSTMIRCPGANTKNNRIPVVSPRASKSPFLRDLEIGIRILGSRTSELISCRSLPAGRQAPPSRQDPWWESRPRCGGFVAGLRPQGGVLAGTSNQSVAVDTCCQRLDFSRCGGFPDHLRPCLRVTYSLSTRTTASGSRSMTVSRMRAARSGTRRPCSHSCTARASRPNRSANFWRLNCMRFRIARICFAAGSSTMRQGKSASPRTWARTSPKAASIS